VTIEKNDITVNSYARFYEDDQYLKISGISLSFDFTFSLRLRIDNEI